MNFGPEEFQTFMTVLLALCSMIAVVGGAVTVIRNAMADALRPLKDIAKRMDDTDKKLDNDKKRLDELEESNRLMLKAMKQLLEHELSGNDRDGLVRMQHEIDEFLINR